MNAQRRQQRYSFTASLVLHLIFPLAIIIKSVVPAEKTTVSEPPMRQVTKIYVGAVAEKPRRDSSVVADRKRVAVSAVSHPVSSEKLDKPFRGQVRIRFVIDHEQYLPAVLSRDHGLLGFGTSELIRQAFEGPRWEHIPVPVEGFPVEAYYALEIDERLGHYQFLDQLLNQNKGLEGLRQYALFSFAFELKIEEQIRRAAAGKCSPGDTVQATLKLDPVSDIRVERIECLPVVAR